MTRLYTARKLVSNLTLQFDPVANILNGLQIFSDIYNEVVSELNTFQIKVYWVLLLLQSLTAAKITEFSKCKIITANEQGATVTVGNYILVTRW